MKLSIVIPVFNEARTARALLDKVVAQKIPVDSKELVIVESNSTDGSREVVQRFVQEAQEAHPNLTIRLVLEETPRGKGAAVVNGLQACTGDIILIQDADLEYDTADYPLLLAPILEGRADFVLGSRHLSHGTWQIRKIEGNPSLSLVMNLAGVFFHGLFNTMHGTRLSDPTTMYKVFRRSCLAGISFESQRFDFDWEIVSKFLRKGHSPCEVPVAYVSRGYGQGKKIRPFRDPPTWVYAILKYRFSRLDPRATELNSAEASST